MNPVEDQTTSMPDSWKMATIGDVASYVRGVTYDKSLSRTSPAKDYTPLLRATNIDSGALILEDFVYVHEDIVKAEQLLKIGDLVIAASSGSSSVVGKSAPIVTDFSGTFGAFCAVLRADLAISNRFLGYYIQSPSVRELWSSLARGTNINNLKRDQVCSTPIAVPPRNEQDEIVRILEAQFSRLDAAAASIAAVRRKADQFRRSLLHAAFTGALTGARSSWPVEQLGSVCKVVSGATPKTSVSAYWEGDIPWLTPNDLSKNRSKVVSAGERAITKAGFDSCSTQIVPAGTVLFTSRAPIGYVAIAGAPLCTNQGFKSAIPNDTLLSDFLFWQLQALTEDIRSRASGTTFLEISAKGFSATQVVVPSLEVQRQVVDVIESQIDRYEGIIHAVKTLDNRIAAMRRSLLHAAFSGELTKEWRNRNYG